VNLDAYGRDPVAFIDRFIKLNEKGRPFRLSDYQRRVLALAFRWSPAGALLMRTLLWSEPKKSGKTMIGACLVVWWGFTRGSTEIIVAANDAEQAVGRVFRTAAALIRQNPDLAASATIRAASIELTNGTSITAIASDYKGAAGARHSLYAVDEPWGITLERAERLVEELTPPPTEPDAWGLMTTTAGFTGESVMLERLYQRGLAGERVDADLEVYRADDLTMFWSHTPRQPWQTGEAGERYYAEQRRSLRPTTYARLHENRWTTGEGSFVAPEDWDACVAPDWGQAEADPELQVWAAFDVGVKHDASAVVAVTVDPTTGQTVLLRHALWTPSPDRPIDLEATVERAVRQLHADYRLRVVYCDPYQAVRSMATLQRDGIPVPRPTSSGWRACSTS
jgi:phage terminase large subunit-like protein